MPARSKSKNQNSKISPLVDLLLSWFAANARDLPWRRTQDPYAIWVSEIMLQQTQVKTVIPYWERWMRELPTIESLAKANPDKIHKLWEGLGYYTRVRNMQKAAQQIISESRRRGDESQTQPAASSAPNRHQSQCVISPPSPPRSGGLEPLGKRRKEFGRSQRPARAERAGASESLGRGEVVLGEQGHEVSADTNSKPSNGPQFPNNFDDVLALPGIGRYTAGAICSIAFNQPTPILDGNVIRVLTRVFGISENPREKSANEHLWSLAHQLVTCASNQKSEIKNQKIPACSHLNQSLMELGALICTPRDPKCLVCPISKHCFAFQNNRVNDFPNLDKRPTATARRFAAFVVENRGTFLVRQRPAGVVNAHLWEFPNIELNGAPANPTDAARELLGFVPKELKPLCTVKHTITRYRITVETFRLNSVAAPRQSAANSHLHRWLPLSELHKLSFPSAHKKILNSLQTARA